METLEISSRHDLSTRTLNARREGQHSYRVNCRQFLTLERQWQRKKPVQEGMELMTLGFERIWLTEAEVKKIESAIQDHQSPLTLE